MTIKTSNSCRSYGVAASFLALVLLATALPSGVLGQTAATGALTGTLKDSSGAVVPNVTVTATNIGTSQARTSTTDATGTYKFGLLPPGDYKLRFEASGFNAAEVPIIAIIVTETSVLDHGLAEQRSLQILHNSATGIIVLGNQTDASKLF